MGALGTTARAETQGYAVINPTATADQRDLLAVVVSLKFPPNVTTVGQALTALLERSGYRLAYGDNTDPQLSTLMHLPLPQVHRSLGPIRLRDALQALAGSAWILVEDPVNRLVSFDLDSRFRLAAHGAGEGV
ncbi:MAG TPA: hypothetical protein VFX11_18950 [Candidatus Kapabacteria bacterium]|nr:hypothetical protein [Candidatus Kapabacteria bacterium]